MEVITFYIGNWFQWIFKAPCFVHYKHSANFNPKKQTIPSCFKLEGFKETCEGECSELYSVHMCVEGAVTCCKSTLNR